MVFELSAIHQSAWLSKVIKNLLLVYVGKTKYERGLIFIIFIKMKNRSTMSDKKEKNPKEPKVPPRTTNPNTTGEIRGSVIPPKTIDSLRSTNKDQPTKKTEE
jgi:hypothetical protein